MRESDMKCVALISGGLDSMLAAALMKEQGIKVLGLSFDIGFGPIPGRGGERENPAVRSGREIGVAVEVLDISEDYVQILLNPRRGYGSAANPCVDCHTEMLRRARTYMYEKGANFMVSGEVVGQRPMSQRRDQLRVVARDADVEDILLRPLSAKLLPPSLPERLGWVKREKLLDIVGRGRNIQIALAKRLKIKEYQNPAGGCLLTEKQFAKKFFDLLDVKSRQGVEIKDLKLLKVGRHFRLSPSLKVIIGRDEAENAFIENLIDKNTMSAIAVDFPGPLAIIDGDPDEKELKHIAKMVARYGKGRNEPTVSIEFNRGDNRIVLDAAPIDARELERWRI